MKKTVTLYRRIPDAQRQRLEQHFNLLCFGNLTETNRQDFIQALRVSDGIIGSSVTIGEELLDFAPHLKAVSTISVGYDNFDVDDLSKRGIRLMHTPGVLTDTTADAIFTLILATARRATELADLIKERRWNKSIGEEYYGVDVHHKTIGILGMGRIGLAVAKRAFCGFDMKVLYMSNRPNNEAEQQYQAEFCSLDDLLQRSDFVCITLPLSKSTEGLISREKLALMKPGAILVNGARGQIVDEQALVEALQNKTILGAGLDVFSTEPLPTDSPFISLPNAVLLPHIGSATHETRTAMIDCAIDNLIAALKADKPSKNWVNPQVG